MAGVVAGLLCATGCASVPKTSRSDVSDFDAMAEAMAQSLAASEALRGRDADSEPWVVTVDRVTNLSDDVMTRAEQWAVMQQIAGSLPVQELRQSRNVTLVLPREKSDRVLSDAASEDATVTRRTTPTHVLHATFRSLERTQAQRRTDLYFCEFELFDVAGGQPVWTDRFEYKRAARGHVWD